MTSADRKSPSMDYSKAVFVEHVHVQSSGQARNGDARLSSSSSWAQESAGTRTLSNTAELKKYLGPVTLLALCFNICSSWAGLSTSAQIALLQGGPVTLVYGTLVISVIYLCISLVLAELASVYPTAGGQYHFTSILAPQSITQSVSYACGFITVYQWVAMGASVLVIVATQIMALVGYFNPGAQDAAWLLFLIYQALGIITLIYNLWALRRLPQTHTLGCILSIAIFGTYFIGYLVRASPKASNHFVWATFVNETGWSDGVCFMTGLVTPSFMYGGLDASLHLSEEAKNPRRVVPLVCVGVVVVGFCTAFPFAIATLYSISDLESIITSTGYVPFEISQQAFRSDTAAAVILCAGIVLGFFILNAVLQSASRVVWAFAKDHGFAYSHILSRIHPGLEIPVWATILTWFLFALVGCIIPASSIAFNAILSSSVVFQLLAIWIPVVLLAYRRRSQKYLPPGRKFALPNHLGWVLTIVVILVIPLLVVMFVLPPFLPLTASNMNYSSVVVLVGGVIALVNWFAHARRHYKGPRIELADRELIPGLEVASE